MSLVLELGCAPPLYAPHGAPVQNNRPIKVLTVIAPYFSWQIACSNAVLVLVSFSDFGCTINVALSVPHRRLFTNSVAACKNSTGLALPTCTLAMTEQNDSSVNSDSLLSSGFKSVINVQGNSLACGLPILLMLVRFFVIASQRSSAPG